MNRIHTNNFQNNGKILALELTDIKEPSRSEFILISSPNKITLRTEAKTITPVQLISALKQVEQIILKSQHHTHYTLIIKDFTIPPFLKKQNPLLTQLTDLLKSSKPLDLKFMK